ncbi:MAG TPA: hypothetical protein VFR37_24390, partial [Longimicrobium sp.]|nr:hypothetical protein [Longimicrobium sp.]
MKRLCLVPALLAGLAACQDFSTAAAPGSIALSGVSAKIDPELARSLALLPAAQPVVVIVNFDPARTTSGTLATALRGL